MCEKIGQSCHPEPTVLSRRAKDLRSCLWIQVATTNCGDASLRSEFVTFWKFGGGAYIAHYVCAT